MALNPALSVDWNHSTGYGCVCANIADRRGWYVADIELSTQSYDLTHRGSTGDLWCDQLGIPRQDVIDFCEAQIAAHTAKRSLQQAADHSDYYDAITA